MMRRTVSASGFRVLVASVFLLPAAGLPVVTPQWAAQGASAAIIAMSAGDPAGHWEGAIELPGMKLELNIDLAKSEAGWTGDVSIPVQKIADFALTDIAVEGSVISFKIGNIPGDPTFKGEAATDGNTISGTFTQGGGAFPFTLTRAADPVAAAADALAGFPEWVDKVRADWKVPGCAVGIVYQDKVIFAQGFGQRDVEQNLPVTTKTLFAIGSSSKAFTTFTLGLLADEGKLDWDKPVRDLMPDFKLEDDFASAHMTPVDLVTHRSGLPRHDLMWYNSSFTREQMYHRLAHLQPNKDFRTAFQYNNLMFMTAGVLVEHITGKTWEDNVRARVFEPLGMARSNFSVQDSQADGDHALPYQDKDDVVTVMPFRNIDSVGPAGSINSCVEDMTQWLRVHLNDGKLGDKVIATAGTVQRLHLPQMVDGGFNPEEAEVIPTGYALGWFTEAYRGHFRIHHGGNIDGFSAQVAFLPKESIGVVVLTNMNGTALTDLVARNVADRLLKLDPIDWNARWLVRRERMKAAGKEAETSAQADRKTGTTPSHALADYAGEYGHEGYGVVSVTLDADRLAASYNNLSAPLEHWHYDVFNCLENPKDPVLKDTKVMFRSNVDGDVDELVVTMDPSVKPVVFTRLGDKVLSDPAYLAKLAGEYDLAGQTIKIEIRGNALFAILAGQPEYELVPQSNHTFKLKSLDGFRVRFIRDEAGSFTTARFLQPNGVFEAKRKAAE